MTSSQLSVPSGFRQVDEYIPEALEKPDMEPLKEFLIDFVKTPVNVDIKEQFVKRSMVFRKKYKYILEATRQVNGNKRLDSVEREYSDFVDLRHSLVSRFKGCFIPTLPHTPTFQLIGRPPKERMERFKTSLQFFLDVLTRNPFIRSDIIFGDFITSKQPFDATKGKRLSGPGQSEQRWRDMIHLVEPPPNRLTARTVALKELSDHLKLYKQIRAGVEAHLKVAAEHVDTYAGIAESFEMFANMEKASGQGKVVYPIEEGNNHGKLVSLDATDALGEVVSKLKLETEAYSAQIPHLQTSISETLHSEIEVVKDLMKDIHDLGGQIMKHNKYVAAYKDANGGMLVANPGDHASGLTTGLNLGDMDPNFENNKKREKYKSDALGIQQQLMWEVNGIIVIEMARWRSERTARLSRMLRQLAANHLDYASKSSNIWNDVEHSFPNHIPPTVELIMLGQHESVTRYCPRVTEPEGDEGSTRSTGRVEHNLLHRSFRESSSPAVPLAKKSPPSQQPPPPPPVQEAEAVVKAVHSSGTSDAGHNGDHAKTISKRASMRVKFEFLPENPDEILLKPGEEVDGEVDGDDPNWFVARTQDGRKGLVPVSYLEELQETNDNTVHKSHHHAGNGSKAPPPLPTAARPPPFEAGQDTGDKSGLLSAIKGFKKDNLKTV